MAVLNHKLAITLGSKPNMNLRSLNGFWGSKDFFDEGDDSSTLKRDLDGEKPGAPSEGMEADPNPTNINTKDIVMEEKFCPLICCLLFHYHVAPCHKVEIRTVTCYVLHTQ